MDRGGASFLRGAARSQAFYSRGDLYDRVAEGSRIQEKQAMPAAEDHALQHPSSTGKPVPQSS